MSSDSFVSCFQLMTVKMTSSRSKVKMATGSLRSTDIRPTMTSDTPTTERITIIRMVNIDLLHWSEGFYTFLHRFTNIFMTNFLDYDEYYENYYLPEYDTAPSRYSNIRPNVEPASRNADRHQNQRGGTLAWASRGGGTWGTSPPPPPSLDGGWKLYFLVLQRL